MSADRNRPEGLDDWLDAQASEAQAGEMEKLVRGSPELRREVELFHRIERSLARSFAAPASPSAAGTATLPVSAPHRRVASAWFALAAAAVIAAVFVPRLWQRSPAVLPSAPVVLSDSCELDRVFCDALAVNFQPVLDCRSSSEWDSRLLASLGSPTCETDAMVVLGEWRDPRLNHSDIVMLRVGAEPVMLLVPRGQADAEAVSRMCLSQGSALHLHRGEWEGRELYELSKLSESRVLECVQAEDVCTVRF